MGDVNIKPGGGGGVDCDNATASAADILSGKTAGIAGSDEPVTGTMPNNGAWRGSVGLNSSVAIPKGYHNGSGVVTGPSVPYQNVEVDGDRANATAISCRPGQINLGVRNGHYLNGVNWIKGSLPNLTAANIKKGVNIGGVVGTWEGYVSPIVFVNATGLTSYSAKGVTPTIYSGQTNNPSPDAIRCMMGGNNGSIVVHSSSRSSDWILRWSGGFFNDAIIVTAYNYVSVTFEVPAGIGSNNYLYISLGLSTNPKALPLTGTYAKIDAQGEATTRDATLVFDIRNISGWQYLLLFAAGSQTSYGYSAKIKEIRFY